MKQLTLAAVGFERYAKTTRRAAFLAEMERVVPWPALCALIEPFYPKPGNGRPPVGEQTAEEPAAESQAGITGDLDGGDEQGCRGRVRRLHRNLRAEIR